MKLWKYISLSSSLLYNNHLYVLLLYGLVKKKNKKNGETVL